MPRCAGFSFAMLLVISLAIALGSSSWQLAMIAGPSIGGALIQFLTAPIAVVVDAVSYVVSAGFLARVEVAEPAVVPTTEPIERINFRDVVNVISGLVLGQRFADLSPEYPTFSVLVTEANRKQLIGNALRALAGGTRTASITGAFVRPEHRRGGELRRAGEDDHRGGDGLYDAESRLSGQNTEGEAEQKADHRERDTQTHAASKRCTRVLPPPRCHCCSLGTSLPRDRRRLA